MEKSRIGSVEDHLTPSRVLLFRLYAIPYCSPASLTCIVFFILLSRDGRRIDNKYLKSSQKGPQDSIIINTIARIAIQRTHLAPVLVVHSCNYKGIVPATTILLPAAKNTQGDSSSRRMEINFRKCDYCYSTRNVYYISYCDSVPFDLRPVK